MLKTFTRTAELNKIGPYTVKVTFRESTYLTLEEVIAITRKCENMMEGKPFCFLADFSSTQVSFSTEARVYLSNNPTALNRHADAIIVPSLAAKLRSDLYLRMHRPLVPTRFFTSEEKALEWITEMIRLKTIHLN
ncbi:MAG TPA: hypothetical protein VI112_05185 [Bacteroidia bacterium]|jgi:hypothetical protein